MKKTNIIENTLAYLYEKGRKVKTNKHSEIRTLIDLSVHLKDDNLEEVLRKPKKVTSQTPEALRIGQDTREKLLKIFEEMKSEGIKYQDRYADIEEEDRISNQQLADDYAELVNKFAYERESIRAKDLDLVKNIQDYPISLQLLYLTTDSLTGANIGSAKCGLKRTLILILSKGKEKAFDEINKIMVKRKEENKERKTESPSYKLLEKAPFYKKHYKEERERKRQEWDKRRYRIIDKYGEYPEYLTDKEIYEGLDRALKQYIRTLRGIGDGINFVHELVSGDSLRPKIYYVNNQEYRDVFDLWFEDNREKIESLKTEYRSTM